MNQHICSPKLYLGIFAALLVLTGVTVIISFFHLGPFNMVVAMSIAVLKASLVVLYFMHVRYSDHLIWVFVGAGVLWLGILLLLLMSDYLTRAWLGSLIG